MEINIAVRGKTPGWRGEELTCTRPSDEAVGVMDGRSWSCRTMVNAMFRSKVDSVYSTETRRGRALDHESLAK